MSIPRHAHLASVLLLVAPLAFAVPLTAQIGVGTWARKETPATPGKMTMTVAACCGAGRRLTYQFQVSGSPVELTVESKFDGTEAPVLMNGKPSGETMAIKRIDAHHASAVVKLNGALLGTSKSTLSADGKTLTVDNDFSSSVGGQPAGKVTETWVHQ